MAPRLQNLHRKMLGKSLFYVRYRILGRCTRDGGWMVEIDSILGTKLNAINHVDMQRESTP